MLESKNVISAHNTSGDGPVSSPDPDSFLWFAIQTYPRHEKRVAGQLAFKGINNYLPLFTRLNQWSDRQKKVETPLFPRYAFVHINPSAESRVHVLQIPGVVGFVGHGKQLVPVPSEQIENIRTLLVNKIALAPYPFLKIGQRVRIRGSALNGIEGILVRRNGAHRLIISVDALERSLSLCVEGLDVEAI
jgi:transcription antitermination factor NusG